jgi:hypothetical protein
MKDLQDIEDVVSAILQVGQDPNSQLLLNRMKISTFLVKM